MSRLRSTTALALFAALLFPLGALALDPINQTTFGGVAIDGYDPVAYFTDGKPVEGSKQFEHDWQGATWRFASKEHRDAFAAAPEKYAPQYGGYCAYAVGNNYTAGIDPDAWSILGGKLYLNYSLAIRDKWLKDPQGYIAKADHNWPGLLKK
jgi:YHS domain-containing protein